MRTWSSAMRRLTRFATSTPDQPVCAVVAEGATYRVKGDWSPHADEGWLGEEIDWLMFTAADVLSAAYPPPTLGDALEYGSPRRVLLIESGAGLEIEAGRALRSVNPVSVELWSEVAAPTFWSDLICFPQEAYDFA